MKFVYYVLYVFLALLILIHCVEQFEPPSTGYNNLLVVEAFLSDADEQLDIKLTRTIPVDSVGVKPETGALVSISDDQGRKIMLQEVNKGIYEFPSNTIAHVGRSYQLLIKTNNNKRYESEMVVMRSTPQIDSVTWIYEEKPILGLKGLQIYVNTHDPANKTWFYRWNYSETWIFNTPYNARIYWEDMQIKQLEEDINTCWKITRSTSIQLGTSKILDQDIIYNYPLLYIDNMSDRLSERYSLNVKQYSLSEESYQYWKELDEFTENLGTLFDPLPYSIRGNIHNVEDENEIVMGYFDVSQVQEKRIFISHIEIPYMPLFNPYISCTDTLVSYGSIPQMILDGYILVKEFPIVPGDTKYVMAYPYCIDCTMVGTNVKPDFW